MEQGKKLEAILSFDSSYYCLGYYMKLPKLTSPSIEAISSPFPNFEFHDSFDYGSKDNYCGGYNISGDCPTAGEIFDHCLNANQEACVEYWGDIIHLRTGKRLGHEVYYDYQKGFAGGQINDIENFSITEITSLLINIANRLIASVGLKDKFGSIAVLPVTSLAAELESSGIQHWPCNVTFHSLQEYYSHECKELVTLKEQLERVRAASTNKEKKDALEGFVEKIIKKTKGLDVLSKDTRGLDSEIDLLIMNECRQRTLEEMGTPFLIECRNWSEPMPAKAIRDFGSKLRDKHIHTGVIVSMKGITGTERTDAKEAIRTFLTRDNIIMLVFDENDLQMITQGTQFIELLKKKFYELRTY